MIEFIVRLNKILVNLLHPFFWMGWGIFFFVSCTSTTNKELSRYYQYRRVSSQVKPLLGVSRDTKGETPLHLAVKNGRIDLVKFMLKMGHSPLVEDNDAYTPMNLAFYHGQTSIVDQMFKAKFFAKKGAKSSLIELIYEKDFNTLYHIYHDKSTLTQEEQEAVSAVLHLAAFYGYLKVIEFFLDGLSYTELPDSHGWNAMHYAVAGGQLKVLQYLVLKQGYSVNQATQRLNPLMIAARIGDLKILDYLLATGIQLDQQDNVGNTAMMLAASRGFQKGVLLLAGYGARVDKVNQRGQTVFHLLAELPNHSAYQDLFLLVN